MQDNPKDFAGALYRIKDSTTICVYAYSSWLFNKFLSIYAKTNGCVEENFPLLLSGDVRDHRIYEKFLAEDGTREFLKNLRPLKMIFLKSREVAGRIFP